VGEPEALDHGAAWLSIFTLKPTMRYQSFLRAFTSASVMSPIDAETVFRATPLALDLLYLVLDGLDRALDVGLMMRGMIFFGASSARPPLQSWP